MRNCDKLHFQWPTANLISQPNNDPTQDQNNVMDQNCNELAEAAIAFITSSQHSDIHPTDVPQYQENQPKFFYNLPPTPPSPGETGVATVATADHCNPLTTTTTTTLVDSSNVYSYENNQPRAINYHNYAPIYHESATIAPNPVNPNQYIHYLDPNPHQTYCLAQEDHYCAHPSVPFNKPPFKTHRYANKPGHNEKERRRRSRIAISCNILRTLIPGLTEKTDKATVFEHAVKYVQHLHSCPKVIKCNCDMETVKEIYD